MRSRLELIVDLEKRAEDADFRPGKLAPAVSVCLRQLRRWVYATRQLTLRDWMRKLRLQKAHAALTDGFSVKEAAVVARYEHASQFSRDYKKEYGFPPSHTATLRGGTRRAARSAKEHEIILDEADGMDWETLMRCDVIYLAPKKELSRYRGAVTLKRRRAAGTKIIRLSGFWMG
jgi:AraC-like DNA-binding protein